MRGATDGAAVACDAGRRDETAEDLDLSPRIVDEEAPTGSELTNAILWQGSRTCSGQLLRGPTKVQAVGDDTSRLRYLGNVEETKRKS